jgi:TRAP-type uncharacterized transport system fused permease subunit
MYSFITPPVALGAFAAAGLSGASPMATGYMAWKIALPGFILPFVFVFYPALLMKGSWPSILYVSGAALLGVFFISAAVAGYLLRNLGALERVLLLVSGVLLIHGSVFTDVIGLIVGGAILLNCFRQARRDAQTARGTVSLAS